MNGMVLAFAVLVLGGAASPAAPQELARCVAGQQVIDKEGRSGVVVTDDSKLCQVKYSDGQIYNGYSGIFAPQRALPNQGW